MSEVCDKLRLYDPEGFLHQIQHTLAEVYRVNGDRFDQSVGDDPSVFGFGIYKNSWFQLGRDLPAFDSVVRVSYPKGSMTIHTPGPWLKFYRGGADETFDLEQYELDQNSSTKRSIPARNAYQLDLFNQAEPPPDQVDEPGPLDLGGWVAVHSGNPDTGLASVWLGAPQMPTYESPSPWAFIFHLPDLCVARGCGGYGSGGVSVAGPPAPGQGPGHAEREEPELDVRRRDDRQSDEGAL